MNPLDNKQDNDPNESFMNSPYITSLDKSYIPLKIYVLLSFSFYGLLLINFNETANILNITGELRFLWVLLLVIAMFIICGIFFRGVVMQQTIGFKLFSHYTGLNSEDREMPIAYAQAGGYDINRWSHLSVVIGIFSVFWWTSTINPDPINSIRSVWVYVVAIIIIDLIIQLALFNIVFSLYVRLKR